MIPQETADLLAEAANEVARLDAALAHPDPDPETLPAVPPGWHPASQMAAEHLCRAVLRGRAGVEAIQRKAREDAQAWADLIRTAQTQIDQQEGVIRDWMLKHDVQNLKTPWFTAYVKQAGSRIVVNDSEKVIALCEAKGYGSAVKTKKVLDKAEFNTFFDADPEAFGPGKEGDGPLAEEVLGEPSLVIRPSAAGRKEKP